MRGQRVAVGAVSWIAERAGPLAAAQSLAESGRSVAELTVAIDEALARGVPHPNAVRLALEQRRQAQAEPPPLAVSLPDHVKCRDVPVRPHCLNDYDTLMENADEHA